MHKSVALSLSLAIAIYCCIRQPLFVQTVQDTCRIDRPFKAMRICSSFELRCEFLFHSSCVVVDFLLFFFFHQGINDQQGTPTKDPRPRHPRPRHPRTHIYGTHAPDAHVHRKQKAPTKARAPRPPPRHPPAAPPRQHPPRHPPAAPPRHPPVKAPTSQITHQPRHPSRHPPAISHPPAKAPLKAPISHQGTHQGTHQPRHLCISVHCSFPEFFVAAQAAVRVAPSA
jgi:hypothetical protein